jgi:6-phosphofructokinase 1
MPPVSTTENTPSSIFPDPRYAGDRWDPLALTPDDTEIPTIGKCTFPSPVAEHLGERALLYVGEADRVPLDDHMSTLLRHRDCLDTLPSFELAGPRNNILLDPSRVTAGIVTCGGLCPGLNNVIRGLVFELAYGYGVKNILGFRYGYEGLVLDYGHEPLRLDTDNVSQIHNDGGTMLGSSRGEQEPSKVVDCLLHYGVNILFVIGGDGTIRGAVRISQEALRRGNPIAVVGVPKTIDNDIHFIDRSFGFESAYSAAVDVIKSAHVEARGARNGIGLVKLMGRHSGFIACHAALACSGVQAVLIPEVPLQLEGERGLYQFIERRLSRKGHAVIVVAEGAGQELFHQSEDETDRSGNVKLKDVGVLLRDGLPAYFKKRGTELTLKYIDPSYHIRSVPASPSDAVYCWNMARNAVHAAMAGNTEMIIGRWHGRFVHVPMRLATKARKQVDPNGDLWSSVLEATGQPVSFS